MSRARGLVAVLRDLAVACVCAALVAWGAVRFFPLADYPAAARPDDSGTASTVLPVLRTTDLATPASMVLEWEPAASLSFAAGAGIVTAVEVAVGSVVDCGQIALEVDGRPTRFMCGERPLWREIPADTPGADQDQVVAFLVSSGYLDDAEVSRDKLRAGLRAFQEADGVAATGRLSPTDVVWLPTPGLTVASVSLAPGTTLVGGDVELFRTASRLTAATVDRELAIAGVAEFVPDGTTQAIPIDTPAATASRLEDLLVPPTSGELVETAPGILRLQTPIEVSTSPASVIVSDGERTCVVSAGSGDTIDVTVVAVEAGTVYFMGGDGVTELVATPPRDSRC